MKLNIIATYVFAVMLSCSAVLAQDDVIILNKDGEKVGVQQPEEIRNVDADAVDGEPTSVKVENGQVTIVGPDGAVRSFDIGEARSVSINRSAQTVEKDGEVMSKTVGKMIVIGPDGERHEFELSGDGEGGGMSRVFIPNGQPSEPKEKSFMIGVHCRPVPDLLRAQLQLEAGAGLAVVQLTKDGPAEVAGVRVNDILMYADDLQLSTNDDLETVTNQAGKEGGKLTLTLIRAAEELDIQIEPTEREGLPTVLGLRGMPGAMGVFEDFGGMPGGLDFEFKEMGPGVIIGREFDAHPGFDAMNERIKQMHERIEKLHKSMLDGGIDQQ